MNKLFKIKIKNIIFISIILSMAVVLLLFSSYAFAAKKKKPKPNKIRTYVTYNNMIIGEKRAIKVAPKKASIKVKFLPVGSQRYGISVRSSNSRIVRVTKKNKYYYKYKAIKSGNVTLTIKSLKKGRNGKRLVAKVRLRVVNNSPLTTINADKSGINQIKLKFDIPILNKFDKNKIKIERYDKKSSDRAEIVNVNDFSYSKDDSMTVLLNIDRELKSDSIYRITYDKMMTELSLDDIGVKRIELANNKIPKNIPTLLKVKAFDKDDNDITDTSFFKENEISFKIISATGVAKMEGNGIKSKLLMIESGSKANIEISYGDKIKYTSEVTCDDNIDASLYNLYKGTVVYGMKNIDWNSIRENDRARLDLTAKNGFVAILVKTKDDKFICNRVNDKYFEPTANFSYSVRKNSKLKVDEKTGALSVSKKGSYTVRITMIYQGNKYQYTLPIMVDEVKPGLITLSQKEVSVSNRNGKATVDITFRDANGNVIEDADVKTPPIITYKNADANSKNPSSEPDALAGLVKLKDGRKLTLEIDGTANKNGTKPSGTYYYEILLGDTKKNNFAREYLIVKVMDATLDSTSDNYRFKEVGDEKTFDLTISSDRSFYDLENLAKGVNLELYSYNQFGTSIGKAGASNYKINGKPINIYDMNCFEYKSDGLYFLPIRISQRNINGQMVNVIEKTIRNGSYRITAECYNTKIGRMVTYGCTLLVNDNQAHLQEGVDFKVKRTGVNGANTILQSGMVGSPSDIAAQIVTKPDESIFMPKVEATGFDVRYPNNKIRYMSFGNRYIIDNVYIPIEVVTRDGQKIFVYTEHNLNINLY